MNCPKCHAAMEPIAVEAITVDRCTGCHGIWFDANEQKKLKDVKGSEKIDIGDLQTGRKMDRVNDISCPRCNTHMIRMVDVDQHHIDYEACTTCYGIFLDAGEFNDLKSFTIADYLRGLFHKKK